MTESRRPSMIKRLSIRRKNRGRDGDDIETRQVYTDKTYCQKIQYHLIVNAVLTLVAMACSISATMDCSFIKNNNGTDTIHQGLFRESINGTCSTMAFDHNDPLLWLSAAGAILSSIMAALGGFLMLGSAFNVEKPNRFKLFTMIFIVVSIVGACLTFSSFASCFCGPCTSGGNPTATAFTCQTSLGSELMIGACALYFIAFIFSCAFW